MLGIDNDVSQLFHRNHQEYLQEGNIYQGKLKFIVAQLCQNASFVYKII